MNREAVENEEKVGAVGGSDSPPDHPAPLSVVRPGRRERYGRRSLPCLEPVEQCEMRAVVEGLRDMDEQLGVGGAEPVAEHREHVRNVPAARYATPAREPPTLEQGLQLTEVQADIRFATEQAEGDTHEENPATGHVVLPHLQAPRLGSDPVRLDELPGAQQDEREVVAPVRAPRRAGRDPPGPAPNR